MNELEKAKAYDKAVEKARQEYNTTENVERKQWLEELFPQLRENKDEKIRKLLIRLFSSNNTNEKFDNISTQEIIGWLEKQDKRQTYQSNERAWLYIVADVLTWREGIGQYLDDPRVQELAKKLQKEYSPKLYVEKQDESDETKAKMFLINKGYPIDANGTFPTYIEMYDIIKEVLENQASDIDINPSEFEMRLNKLLKQFESLPKEDIVSSLSFYLNVIQNDGTYIADENQCKMVSKLDIDDMVEKYKQEQFPLHNSSTSSHSPYYPIGYIDNMIAQYRKGINDTLNLILRK